MSTVIITSDYIPELVKLDSIRSCCLSVIAAKLMAYMTFLKELPYIRFRIKNQIERRINAMTRYVGLLALVLAIMSWRVDAQDQSGFISIDCGSTTSYTDDDTNINYVPDANFIDTGESKSIATQYKTTFLEKQFENVRSFPKGERNCYTLTPPFVDATQYLIRARFMYGNYDSLNQLPEFDLYVGVNLWTTVTFYSRDQILTKEIIQARTSSSNVTHLCLVNKGLGKPFISVLELRLMDNTLYPSKTGSLSLYHRINLGTYYTYRYGSDPYDRIWRTVDWSSSVDSLSAMQTVYPNRYKQPYGVISTAVTPRYSYWPLAFYSIVEPGAEYYFFFHFAEVQIRTLNQTRKFDMYVNGSYMTTLTITDSPIAYTVYTGLPQTARQNLTYSFETASDSDLPPILNAFEIYQVKYMQELETDPKDAEAIINIKKAYNIIRSSWQGDPCAPRDFTWEGLYCSFANSFAPRIITLNLSSSDLTGEISKHISDLTLLKTLDLSNNNLNGQVPDFLSQMTSLSYIDLSGNNLKGILPPELVQKNKKGLLMLNVEKNPQLCLSAPCQGPGTTPTTKSSKDGKKEGIPIIASVFGLIALILVALFLVICLRKRRRANAADIQLSISETDNTPPPLTPEPQSINGQFSLSNVLSITSNFSVVIGSGRFGIVYHCYLGDDTQVAVKMLSRSASQGYTTFKIEAEKLMTIHHSNLVALIGYCGEGDQKVLVYEHVGNGNLTSHIYSDTNPHALTWEYRLHIAIDAAQGLEHLHQLSMVHGDLKPTNILLTGEFQAKLSSFGLSIGSGTPEYLDPESQNPEQVDAKSDIFSFGVILLEIITSRNAISGSISEWVNHVLSTHKDVKYVVDPRLEGQFDMISAWRVVEMAMKCVSVNPNARPNMFRIVNELRHCLELEKLRNNEFTVDSIKGTPLALATD